MRRLPKQAVLAFGRKEKVLNRQLRERAEGKKVRPGPGRPSKNNGRVPHRQRPALGPKSAVHVTLRTAHHVPNLRARKRFSAISRAFVRYCGSDKSPESAGSGFRLVHFAVLSNHVHLVVEADSSAALSKGLQRLLHSISRRLNALSVKERGGHVSTHGGSYRQLAGWLGRIFSDRYHARRLKTPTEMANAVEYVLRNAERHYGQRPTAWRLDPFSSAAPSSTTEAKKEPLVAKPGGVLLATACRRMLRLLSTA